MQSIKRFREALNFYLEGERLVKHKPVNATRALKDSFATYGTDVIYASVDIVSRITVTDCMFYCVSAQQDGQFVRLHVCMVELPMTVCLYTRVDAGLYVCMPLCMCDSACCLVWL